MFKLIFFLVGLLIAILFSAFNFRNTANISLGFMEFTDIPVFLSIFISFIAGAVFTMPFAFYTKTKNRMNASRKNKPENKGRTKKSKGPETEEPAVNSVKNEDIL